MWGRQIHALSHNQIFNQVDFFYSLVGNIRLEKEESIALDLQLSGAVAKAVDWIFPSRPLLQALPRDRGAKVELYQSPESKMPVG